MSTSPLPFRALWLGLLFSAAFTGCVNEPRSHRDRLPPDAEQPTPEMEGHATVLHNTVAVDVLLNRAGFGGRAEGGGRAPERGGGGGMRGGFRGAGGGRRGGGRGGEQNSPDNADGPAVHIAASNLPPVRLHLRFTNNTDAAIDLSVPQFDSDLGNFVVQPATISVPAHGTAEATPMTSTLGVSASEVPITLTVEANGVRESQVVALRMRAPLTPPPPAP